MRSPKGAEKTAVWVAEVEWAGLGKCDPVGARIAEILGTFWTPVDVIAMVMKLC